MQNILYKKNILSLFFSCAACVFVRVCRKMPKKQNLPNTLFIDSLSFVLNSVCMILIYSAIVWLRRGRFCSACSRNKNVISRACRLHKLRTLRGADAAVRRCLLLLLLLNFRTHTQHTYKRMAITRPSWVRLASSVAAAMHFHATKHFIYLSFAGLRTMCVCVHCMFVLDHGHVVRSLGGVELLFLRLSWKKKGGNHGIQ